MAWQTYQLTFRVLSNLHIGYQRIGNVQRTRWYIPARVLWGALTARLTRNLTPQAMTELGIRSGDYSTMGQRVADELAFSYFYPADADGQPLYPHVEDGDQAPDQGSASDGRSSVPRPAGLFGLRFGQGNLPEDQFAWRYLASYAATALNYGQNAAEEGTLHEIEFLAPHTRSDSQAGGYPVTLTGYALVAQECRLPWRTMLQEIQVGGERTYGWGRLRLQRLEGPLANDQAHLFGTLAAPSGALARPRIRVNRNQPLLAHTRVTGVKASGDVEPLVARIWHPTRGAGQHVEVVGVCYAPGARFEGADGTIFEWSMNHIWERVPDMPLSS